MTDPLENLHKIDHIVVLMMENRSFDHMLGFLTIDSQRDDVDGVKPEMANEHEGERFPVHPALGTTLVKAQDPCHSSWCVDDQVENDMGGFVSNFVATRSAPLPGDQGPAIVMAYHTAKQLPVYDYLATNFCVCDRWFCPVPGATMPNRLYAVAGRAAGSRDNAHPPLYNLKSFVRHLDNARVPWQWFAHDNFLTLWAVDRDYGLTRPMLPAFFDREPLGAIGQRSFIRRAAAGQLPAVSWIDPNFADIRYGPARSNDDHPPSDLRAGQELVFKLFNALVRGPKWPKTLLLITYDEHGGFYDHVVPPAAADDDERFRRYGPRVPALVVSPWVGEGAVSSTIFDHTSIIKTILLRFCRKSDGTIPHMSARVAAAHHLGETLTETSARPAPPVQAYQALIDHLAEWRREAFAADVEAVALGDAAAPPDLTDWQEDYIEAKAAFFEAKTTVATTPVPVA